MKIEVFSLASIHFKSLSFSSVILNSGMGLLSFSMSKMFLSLSENVVIVVSLHVVGNRPETRRVILGHQISGCLVRWLNLLVCVNILGTLAHLLELVQ